MLLLELVGGVVEKLVVVGRSSVERKRASGAFDIIVLKAAMVLSCP